MNHLQNTSIYSPDFAQGFGLSGQDEYDAFLCLSKKCKEKKKKRQEIRNQKKKLKNDVKRAEIERTKTETKLMESTLEPSVQPRPNPKVPVPQPANLPPAGAQNKNPEVEKPSFPIIPVAIVGGLVLAVGAFFIIRNRKLKLAQS